MVKNFVDSLKADQYTVQLCRLRYAYDKSTTLVVSWKPNLQLACDFRVFLPTAIVAIGNLIPWKSYTIFS